MTGSDLTEVTPTGWAVAKLAHLVEGAQGGFASGKKDVAGGLTHLRMNNIGEEGELVLDLLRTVPPELAREHHRLRRDDVLVCTTNSGKLVGKCALFRLEGDFAFSNHITRLRPIRSLIEPDYLRWRLWVTWRTGSYQPLCQHWVNQSTLPKEALLDIAVELPPLAEQRRIVAKVEEVLGRVNAARERLAKVPAILKRFCQSVLAAACSGRLTADWRGDDGADEAVLPPSWKQASVAEICDAVVDCPHSTPKWTNVGEICLRTTNFKPGLLDLSEVRYVSAETYASRIARLEPRQGDVLYSREGGILGIACLFPRGLRACLGQRMMLMRPGVKVRPQFLMHVLNSPQTSERVRDLTGGTASPHLNVGDVKAFGVPLPPLEEQDEILKRLSQTLSLTTQIASRITGAALRAEKLVQATLAKAFRGELVPTEAELAEAEGRTYESAEALLARIGQARAEATPPAAGRGRRPKPGGSNGVHSQMAPARK